MKENEITGYKLVDFFPCGIGAYLRDKRLEPMRMNKIKEGEELPKPSWVYASYHAITFSGSIFTTL